eukprot:jgi/Chrpa1/28046/Chrysochromulina_OHIO_Genome00010650-RA
MADVAPAAAPAADEAQPEPSSSVEYESEKKMNISVDGTAFDLTALLNFSLLQDMLRKLAQQQREQATLIRGLRQDLEKANREGEAVAKRLKDEIDTKANEKALTALALETQRDKAAMEKRQEQLDSKMDHAFDKVDQRLEALQSKIYDCKVELESKAAQRSVDALELRVNEKASVLELADVKKELTQRVDSFEKTTEARFDRNEASTESNTKRIMSLEQRVISFASIEMVQEVERKMVEADAMNMAETQAVEARRAAALAECRRELEMKHMKHEEDLTNHWTHIRDAEALIKTKANNEEMLRGFEQQKVDLHAVDQKHTAALKPVSEKLDKYIETNDTRFAPIADRLTFLENEIPLKATAAECQRLEQLIGGCAMRLEMRELMESLRQETTSRVRMLKERLDRTDRELLRQLEESQNNDRSDKFDALAAMIETKADKALTERWLEASQQLHGELQTVHVRTQTLGQGMKVVLGWVEGMADKVTGLQGAQHRMAQQVSQQREELQFGLNATARETISKVKGMLVLAPTTPAPLPSSTGGSMQGSKPLTRPTTAAEPAFAAVAAAPPRQPAAVAFSDEATAAVMDPEGRQLLLEGQGALAGPAGAALAGVTPVTGVMGRQQFEKMVSEVDLPYPEPSRTAEPRLCPSD